MKATKEVRFVVIPMIPGTIKRGNVTRSGLEYAEFGIAPWQWWCRRHKATLVIVKESPCINQVENVLPPTFQRWIAVAKILRDNKNSRVLVVDADTMVRWDTPDIFARVPKAQLGAVRDWGAIWIHRSIRSYQYMFPNTSVEWWQYVNAGVVVLSSRHLPLLESVVRFASERASELAAIQASKNVGTDQTVFNFVMRQGGVNVTWMPPVFNLLHCVPMDAEIMKLEGDGEVSENEFLKAATSKAGAFDFIEMAYVWHFTNVVNFRKVIMGETWRRVSDHYVTRY